MDINSIYKMGYKIEENQNKLKILGTNFVKNNRNKAKLVINNKKSNLKDELLLKDINFPEYNLKIKMILLNNLSNRSYMFKDCESLLELLINNNIQNKEFKEKINNNSSINVEIDFEGEDTIYHINEEDNDDDNDYSYSLSEKTNNFGNSDSDEKSENFKTNVENLTVFYLLSEIKFSKNNYYILTEMFKNCKSLLSLSEILNNYKYNNIIDISNMFYNCSSIKRITKYI